MKVAILGLAYRGGVKEHAFSGTWSLAEELRSRNASVSVLDPMYSDEELRALGFEPLLDSSSIELVIVQTNHSEFLELKPKNFPAARLVIDGRNFLSEAFSTGPARYLSIGIG